MVYIIDKGTHRAKPFRFGFYHKAQQVSAIIRFDESCRYDLGNDNQLDLNKLFGVGFVRNPIRALFIAISAWISKKVYNEEHHKESARIGWRYNKAIDMIDLYAYCYVSGQRITKIICSCEIGKNYMAMIDVKSFSYIFKVSGEGRSSTAIILHVNQKKWSYALNPYFGGDEVAPHDIKNFISWIRFH